MPDLFLDVDTALAEVPVNLMPLISSVDQQSVAASLAYNAPGLQLFWNFLTTDGQLSRTQVVPTSGGAYDWAVQGGGIYTVEIPASGGASINNDREGTGWFTGVANGVLPWRGPTIGFRSAALNGALLNGGGVGALPQFGIVDQGLAQAVGASTIQLRAAAPMANGSIVGSVVVIRSASSGAGQSAVITAYASATQTATISPAWVVTPTGPVEYQILAAPRAPTDAGVLPQVAVAAMNANTLNASALASDAVAEIQAGLATASALASVAGYVDTEMAAVAAVTAKLDTALEADGGVYRLTANALELAPTGGLTQQQAQDAAAAALTAYDPPTKAELDAAVAPLATSAGVVAAVDPIPTLTELNNALAPLATSAGLASAVAPLATNTALAQATSPLASAAALASVATNVGQILGHTGTTLPALINSLNDVTVQEILTTQMSESYAANGSAPTLAQALFAIHQHLMSFVISGTSRTVRRLDGSTTAFVETLNDGTNPTGLTR